MTTMTSPLSFPLAAEAECPEASRPVPKSSTSGKTPRGRLAGVFALSTVIGFFTLLGMLTAESWLIDRYVAPRFMRVYEIELSKPSSVLPLSMYDEDPADTAATVDSAATNEK